MAVRFIIGRAGTGKTRRCVDAVRARLRDDPIDGPRLVVLVPEQASFQTERALLDAPARDEGAAAAGPSAFRIPAAHRAEVVSFQRLAFRVLEFVGQGDRDALTEPSRAMVIRLLLLRHAPQLHYYKRFAQPGRAPVRLGGLVQRLCESVREFIQEEVTPEALCQAAEASVDNAVDPGQSAKLHDLSLIFQAYLDYLGTGRLDPAQYLEFARQSLSRCTWLHGAQLWVDGFASFSAQETRFLTELVRLCECAEVTVLLDPREVSSDIAHPLDSARIFAKTSRTFRELHRAFVDAGIAIENPVFLEPNPPWRFAGRPELVRLERHLFAETPPPASHSPPESLCIQVAELPSRRLEVEYAVAAVQRWVRDPRWAYRYRDIAIIVRDLGECDELLRVALEARNIPYFIDRRRSVAHHPLVELIRGLAGIASDSLTLELARSLLKTGLLGLDDRQADELENYLIAHGVSGLEAWRRAWTVGFGGSDRDEHRQEPSDAEIAMLDRVNTSRSLLLERLGPWLEFCGRRGGTGPAWADALTGTLQQFGVDRMLTAWAADAETSGDLDLAGAHRQTWRDVLAFFDDSSRAFAEAPLTALELNDVLDAGLAELSLGLVPPTVDQILVGAVERSRHPNVRAAVIIGFNDDCFPARPVEDSILNDDDRSLLRERDLHVGPGARERILDESMLAYIAVTRASDALLITYARTGGDGRALRPSTYLPAILSACPGLSVSSLGDPSRSRETWDVLSTSDLARGLALEMRHRPPLVEDTAVTRGKWNALYEQARTRLLSDREYRPLTDSLGPPRVANLSPASVQRLHAKSLSTSVSQLETYAACPFKYFAQYGLGLRERREAVLRPVDVGDVHHRILEDFVSTLYQRGGSIAELEDTEIITALHRSCDHVAEQITAIGETGDARSAYVLRRSAREVARVLRAQRDIARFGRFRNRAAELPFGFAAEKGLDEFELRTPNGRRAVVRGYIDRVDLAELADEVLGVVVDYKRYSKPRPLSMAEVYHGLSLQLLAYLLVLSEKGSTLAGRPVQPVAALYVDIAPRYTTVSHPGGAQPVERSTPTVKPRGLILASMFSHLDDSNADGWSDVYNVHRKKDGTLGHQAKSDSASPSEFSLALKHVRRTLGVLADGILDGRIPVQPYRLRHHAPCSWCPFQSVCRFEMGLGDVRFLDSLKRSDVFRRLQEDAERREKPATDG